MKKAICFLTVFGLGLLLVAGCPENSKAEMITKFATSDTLSAKDGQIPNKNLENSHKMVSKKKFSYTPKPLSECKSFLITECGFSYGLDKRSNQTNPWLYTWELGYMVNRDEHSAIGGTVFISSEADRIQIRLGLKGRYRYWLSKNQSVDIAPGILITGSKDKFEFPSFTCQTGLNLSSWFAITGQVDIVRRKTFTYGPTWFAPQEKTVTKPEWYLGLKLGTPAGAGIGTLAVIVAALAMVSNLSVPNMSGSF